VRRAAAAALAALSLAGCRDEAPEQRIGDAPGDAPATAATACGVLPTTVLTGDGIGEAAIGRPVDELADACAVLSDTTRPGPEGMTARVLTLDLGRATVEGEVSEGRLWRIAVRSPEIRTSDSLGVGTPLARLLEVDGVRGLTGEGAVFVQLPAHCGLSFRLSVPATSAVTTEAELRRLPAETRVTEVLVVGCAPQYGAQ
jgi:hypothetical protein